MYFLNLGDRFWYENDLPPSAFTLGAYMRLICIFAMVFFLPAIFSRVSLIVVIFLTEQLQEIRKTSLGKKSLIIAKNVNNETPPLARIVCDNSNALREIQPNVFLDRDPFL